MQQKQIEQIPVKTRWDKWKNSLKNNHTMVHPEYAFMLEDVLAAHLN